MVPKPGASQIVDALIPPVMEEIIEAVRRIPHERIRQRIVEETVRADTSCAGAGIVADSEQLAFESNPVVRADPADAVKSLAATLASEVASKNRCAHVTADHEVSVETFADELQVLAETTHVPGSETCATGGHAWPLSQVSLFTGVYTTVDPKVFDVMEMDSHGGLEVTIRQTESKKNKTTQQLRETDP